MPHLGALLPFITICLIIEITPGPNMIYLAVLSISRGRRAGFFGAMGAATGLLIIGVIAALGMTAIIVASPPLYQILRWSGVLYLLWLACESWKLDEADIAAADSVSMAGFFQKGLLTNILNPKAAIFYFSVLPDFVNRSDFTILNAVVLTMIYVGVATFIHLTIVMLAGQAHKILRHSHWRTGIRRILSLLLVLIALWLAWVTRAAKF